MVSGGPQMSQQDRFAAVELEKAGVDRKQIARQLGYTHRSIRRFFQRLDFIAKIARKVWRQVTSAYLETLYESMPRRMQAVVEAQGGHTKY